MQTTKQTIITLDPGESILVRTVREDGTFIQAEIAARGHTNQGALTVQTDEVAWTNGPRPDTDPWDADERVGYGDKPEDDAHRAAKHTYLASENDNLTITLV